MRKLLLSILVVVITVCFSGCGTIVQSNVTRFHQLPSIGAAKTFQFFPDQSQKGSLEYSTYCSRIEQKLSNYGWRVEGNTSALPDYFVYFTYSIDNGTTVSGSMPIFGQTGGGTSYSYGTVNTNNSYGSYSGTTYTPATFGQVGSVPYSQTVYSRNLILTIVDAKSTERNGIVKVFEGRVASRGTTGEVSAVMPTMIEVLFKKFPGISGKSEHVEMGLVD